MISSAAGRWSASACWPGSWPWAWRRRSAAARGAGRRAAGRPRGHLPAAPAAARRGDRPGQTAEMLTTMFGAPMLAALTLAPLRGYRALAVASALTVLAYAVDVVAGSPLTALSLLGPNPGLGVRFYGIGNELEALLGGAGRCRDRRGAGRVRAAALEARLRDRLPGSRVARRGRLRRRALRRRRRRCDRAPGRRRGGGGAGRSAPAGARPARWSRCRSWSWRSSRWSTWPPAPTPT